MSQARVTDFFASRKSKRFSQDEVLLNKQKKAHILFDASDSSSGTDSSISPEEACNLLKKELAMRTTRSKTRSQTKEETTQKEEENEASPKKRTSARKKQHLEELKQRANRLDHKLSKLEKSPEQTVPEADPVEPVTLAPVEANVEPAKKPTRGKKINMAELKERMQKFNQKLDAVKENFSTEETQKVKQVELEIKEAEAPAHLKFKDLASSDIDLSCTLTLPLSYAQLLDAFKGSDTIVKFLFNRQEICTFLKLKMGIQNITKHTFTLSNLAQIKTVYPLAYLFKQEKMFIDFKNDFHLTINPNLDELELNIEKGIKEFTPNALLTRLNTFKSSLFKIVKEFHQKFLESIGLTNVNAKDIKRWHPKFDLESIQSIEEAELPKSPNDAIKCKTGQDLLNIAKDIYSSRIKEAIKDHLSQSEQEKKEEPIKKVVEATIELEIVDDSTKSSKKLNENKDVQVNLDDQVMLKLKEKKAQNYTSLLEKIRNKEKTKAFESMVVNSSKEKLKARYGHYKEIIRFLLGYFQSEKKSTIEQDKLLTKLSDSFKEKLNELECREILNELCDLEKFNLKWICVIKVRNINWIKMDKSFQLNDLWAKCDKLLEEL